MTADRRQLAREMYEAFAAGAERQASKHPAKRGPGGPASL